MLLFTWSNRQMRIAAVHMLGELISHPPTFFHSMSCFKPSIAFNYETISLSAISSHSHKMSIFGDGVNNIISSACMNNFVVSILVISGSTSSQTALTSTNQRQLCKIVIVWPQKAVSARKRTNEMREICRWFDGSN